MINKSLFQFETYSDYNDFLDSNKRPTEFPFVCFIKTTRQTFYHNGLDINSSEGSLKVKYFGYVDPEITSETLSQSDILGLDQIELPSHQYVTQELNSTSPVKILYAYPYDTELTLVEDQSGFNVINLFETGIITILDSNGNETDYRYYLQKSACKLYDITLKFL